MITFNASSLNVSNLIAGGGVSLCGPCVCRFLQRRRERAHAACPWGQQLWLERWNVREKRQIVRQAEDIIFAGAATRGVADGECRTPNPPTNIVPTNIA